MGVALSFVLLNDSPEYSIKSVKLFLEEHWPEVACEIKGADEEDTNECDDAAVFSIGDANVAIARMPAPYPWSDLEGPCATSILWPNATEELEPHSEHLLITVMGELQPPEDSVLLTQLTAAVLAGCEQALGVYWGNATLVVPKNMFIEMATAMLPDPPMPIWVDLRVGPDEQGKMMGFTQGMSALGLMEMETLDATDTAGELRERLWNLALYLIENGSVIEDGHTVGSDAKEKIRVIYCKSHFGHEGQVMRLVYEETSNDKPWWKFW